MADGSTSEGEQAWLEELARALDLDPARQTELEMEARGPGSD